MAIEKSSAPIVNMTTANKIEWVDDRARLGCHVASPRLATCQWQYDDSTPIVMWVCFGRRDAADRHAPTRDGLEPRNSRWVVGVRKHHDRVDAPALKGAHGCTRGRRGDFRMENRGFKADGRHSRGWGLACRALRRKCQPRPTDGRSARLPTEASRTAGGTVPSPGAAPGLLAMPMRRGFRDAKG